MGYAILNNIKLAIKEEVIEGNFVAPSTGADFIQVSGGAPGMEPSKELIERDLLGGGLSKATPRTGLWSVSGSINVEAKAAGTEGGAPEYGLLMESGLGSKRSGVTKTTSDADGGTYSDKILCFATADMSNFHKGDTLLVKRASHYHLSPIASVSGNEVTLLIADPQGDFVDGLEVAAFTTYIPADTGHKAISISRYIEDAVLEKAVGCKVKDIKLNGFETGKTATWEFGFEGLFPEREVSANSITPAYDSALPPIVLSACVYQDGVSLPVNTMDFNISNELGFITSTCAEKGKISSRITKRTIAGNLTPYKANDAVAQWDKFKNNTEYSVFGYMYVPSTTSGEYGDVVAFYMPYCVTSQIGEGDKEGVLQDTLAFSAGGGSNLDTEIYITFI